MPGGFSDQELSEKARRFRVLIIGRANSGKTTILKKICNTTDDPIVYDDRGKRISNLALKPTRNRGMHDIESEISFRSSPQFVFHDSRGFEAGGKEEMEKVKTFISERSKSKKLQDQIHVIWYCIPMDNDRPVTHAEEEFFSKSVIKKVPVVLIFTKCEALQGAAVNKLQNQGLTWEQAVQGGPEHAEEILNMVNEVVKQKPYPPQAHICLQGKLFYQITKLMGLNMYLELNQPHTTCHDLVKHTAAVLTSKNLQALFISTQQNSLELAMEYSIRCPIHFK
ncbi:hypothetical protein BDZ94DRAFT_1171259 [Collybia nuda]|uniref:G domain-containing protein n=1 Tax=Collybia nuda TaxID=64659 RepID=A0A9P5Y1R4_9AGAR|nr:hypothetical protein BDZ94DRAFT_1171259 [Collybia nuda]